MLDKVRVFIDQRGSAFVDSVVNDVRYAVRTLHRTPGFATAAILTLALGIGASTAIFTVIDGVLLKPLPFPHPDQLTMVWPTSGSRVSPGYFHDWRRESRAFQDMAAWFDARLNLSGGKVPLEVLADRATTNFFAVLGVPAFLGRTFTVEPDLSTVPPEVVLSYGFWQRHYGGDPGVIGQAVTLDGQVRTVIGVMPAGFTVRTRELSESRAELWVPFRLTPGDRVGMGGFLNVVGRLAPDITRESAQAELALIARRIEQQYPSYSRNWGVTVVRLHDATVKDVRATLLVLFGAVGLLLLIACANVANLTLTRAVARQPEFAIRLSLGASAGRLRGQLLTESVVLAAIGGALGVLIAVAGTRLLASVRPAGLDLPRAWNIGVDVRVLSFAIVTSILTAILFGLVPALRLSGSVSQGAFRETARGSSAGRRRSLLANALIVSEVALAVIVLAAAGLLARSYWALSRVDPGFRSEQVFTMRTTLPTQRYESDDRIRAFSSELLRRIENLPGVHAVGLANYLPLSRIGAAAVFEIEGRPVMRPQDQRGSWITVIGGKYFDAMRIPLLRGRLPGEADTNDTTPVFVIDEELARVHWPNRDPIGERLVWPRDDDERFTGEIIGIVGNVRYLGLAGDRGGMTYFWHPQNPTRELSIVAKTATDPELLARLVAEEVAEIDPNQPVANVRVMGDFVSDDLARPRFTSVLLACFAAAALLLAIVGLYGVIAFRVTRRTHEIGIRVALGARRNDVLRLILKSGFVLTATGLGVGIAAVLALGRLVSSLLYGVEPSDPPTLAAVSLLLLVVAMAAAYVPARRASRVDPMVALRCE
jgi:putative ABC transport system permease protein